MRSRPGVSLVEVLVAALLLAVGMGGAMGALLAAARLRDRAGARETVARVVEARLAWFQARACAAVDTVFTAADASVEESWRITVGAGASRIEGRALALAAGRPVRLGLAHERRCP